MHMSVDDKKHIILVLLVIFYIYFPSGIVGTSVTKTI